MAASRQVLSTPFLSRCSNSCSSSEFLRISNLRKTSSSKKFTLRGLSTRTVDAVFDNPPPPALDHRTSSRDSRSSNDSRQVPYVDAETLDKSRHVAKITTTVPRSPHIRDGDWNAADVKLVRRAMDDSFKNSPKFDPKPSKEHGNNILLGRSLDDLQNLSLDLGEKKYRGKQLHQFLYKNHGKDYSELLLLPQRMRDALSERGFTVGRTPVHHVAASADGTAKILLRLEDSRLVEAVGIPTETEEGKVKLTACVSSQVGCPLRCNFCATGKGGFARNLKPHEIVSQVLALEEMFKMRVNNVVFMGMGEPLLNLSAVLEALRCLNKDLGIGQRMMTISTVGVPNTIQRLAVHKLQSTLAISLHAPNQRLREGLVPSAKAYPLEALLEDCKAYFETTGRRVSFEYTLLASVNDQPSHANELATLLHRFNLGNHVNVIPYNPVQDSDYRRPNKAHVFAFVEALKQRKITVSIRQTRGMDANAACGQLRNDFQKVPIGSEQAA